MKLQPYVFFDGRAEEAINFYKKALGAQVEMLMRFKESPEPPRPGMTPPSPDKVMHAQIKIGDTVVLMSDGECHGRPSFQGFALALGLATEPEADRAFTALAEGGQVQMPLTKTFFSPKFGMLADRFGVMWMLMVGK